VDVHCFADWSAGPSAPLVVFLHHYGFGATGQWWSGLFGPVVDAGGRYLSPSFPGHGLTAGASSSRCEDLGKPDGPVELLRGLLDWAGEAKAILVGWDWGAGIAAEFAIKYPKRTAQLCVQCMSYRDETRLAKLAKRGKNILFFWDKDDPNRSAKKGKAFAAAMQAKYREIDDPFMETKIVQWVKSC
jgi:pimeloyl-ACP methyl ester carboxylesterase